MKTTAASLWAVLSSYEQTLAQDIPAGSRLVGTVPFIRPSSEPTPLERTLGSGLDGRFFTNLESLGPDTLVTSNDRFFVRTAFSNPLQSTKSIELVGLVSSPETIGVAQLEAMAGPAGIHLLECAGNTEVAAFGLISTARWEGVPLASLIERAVPARSAGLVLVSGVDDRTRSSQTSVSGASWIFSRADLDRSKAFLAVRMNGAPLPPNHGAPVRLVVPGWYGCACIKWVDRIELVEDSAAATSQMREYASRTHQPGQPGLARDYLPAAIDTAAMPVRIERWIRPGGQNVYRVVGVIWGGPRPTNALLIRFKHTANWVPVSDCPLPASSATWSLWSHWWAPDTPGRYDIVLKVDDPSLRTRRLDLFFYVRSVTINDV